MELMSLYQKFKVMLGIASTYDDAVAKAKESGVDAKSIFTSKTFWFNLVLGLFQVADNVGAWNIIPQPYGAIVLMVGNILLRGMTYQPVKIP